MEIAEGFFGFSLGFGFYQLFSVKSHPLKMDSRWPSLAIKLRFYKAKINKMVPNVKLKYIEFSPIFKLRLRNRIIHLHHWFTLTLVLMFLMYISTGFTQLFLIKSFCVGGAVQGLIYEDRFKFLIREQN
jgi:hypothetical protein